MITHYIAYYEGLDANGNVIVNGNIAASAEDLTDAGEFMNYLTKKTLDDTRGYPPTVTRIVLKGIFKL